MTMTEAEWLEQTSPEPMLRYLEGKIGDRKLRLFACACCRRIWPMVKDPLCCQAVEAAEDFADGAISLEELTGIHEAAQLSKPLFADASWAAAWAAAPVVAQAAEESALHAALSMSRIAAESAKSAAWAAVRSGATEEAKAAAWAQYDSVREVAQAAERQEQAALLREIIGNPFEEVAATTAWPLAVVQLAESLYAGVDCAFALHDALLETGQTDVAQFAEHFRAAGHPKGCWALDMILGKTSPCLAATGGRTSAP